jgi:hypothetical protein
VIDYRGLAVLDWATFSLALAGFLVLLYAAYRFLAEIVYWLQKPRDVLSRAAWMARRAQKPADGRGFMEPDFPWGTTYALAFIGAVFLWFAMSGMSLQYVAIGALLLPILGHQWIVRQAHRNAENEIRQFLVELRLQLSSGGTLRPALQAVCQYGPVHIGKLLRELLAGQENGGQILHSLADATKSRWLNDVAGRAEAAQQGMLNLDEAVAQSIERVTGEMDTEIREELQRIPTRLVVIVAPLLLAPALAAWVIPVVAHLIASLEGTSFVGIY